MITATKYSTRSHGRNLSDDFCLVLTSQRQSVDDATAVADAHCRITEACKRTVTRTLLSWFVPNAATEAEDIVQQWQVAMLDGGFARWEMEQSIHAFANQVLRRLCIAFLRRHLRRRVSQIVTDPKCDCGDALTAMVQAEDRLALRWAIAQLPPTLRCELESWLAEGFPRGLDGKARRRRSRMLWRAKQRLRELLTGREVPVGKKS